MNEGEIQIFNFNNKLREDYKLNKQVKIEKENLEELLDNDTSENIRINAKIIENFIIIITVKVKNKLELETKNAKNIELNCFNIMIIKYDHKTNNNQKISINIPIKGEKIIAKNNFFNSKFYFFDLACIDNSKCFFILYCFDQLHFFKLYEKDDKLKYNKIKIKNFNTETKVVYLGHNILKEKDILEIGLLLKPANNFYFIPIDTTDENKKLEEKEIIIDNEEYKSILKKIKRSNCGIYVITNKENNLNYIASKGNGNDNQIDIKELIFNQKDIDINFKIIHLFKIIDKLFIIVDNTKIEDENKYLTFEIYDIFLKGDVNKYYAELLQRIKIKSKGEIKEYNININSSNNISINCGEKLYLIHLDDNGLISTINVFEIESNSLQIEKYYYDKYQDIILLIFLTEKKIFYSKFCDEFNKNIKYVSNENKIEENQEEKKFEEIKEQEFNNNKNIINENKINNNEIQKDSELSNIIEGKKNNKYKIEIEIEKNVEKNKNQIINLVKEQSKKLKIIKKNLNSKKEDIRNLENRYKYLSQIIIKLKKRKNENNDDYNEDIEAKGQYINNYNDYNDNYSYYNMYNNGMENHYNQMDLMNQMNQHNLNQPHYFNYNYQGNIYNNPKQITTNLINQSYKAGNIINPNYIPRKNIYKNNQ